MNIAIIGAHQFSVTVMVFITLAADQRFRHELFHDNDRFYRNFLAACGHGAPWTPPHMSEQFTQIPTLTDSRPLGDAEFQRDAMRRRPSHRAEIACRSVPVRLLQRTLRFQEGKGFTASSSCSSAGESGSRLDGRLKSTPDGWRNIGSRTRADPAQGRLRTSAITKNGSAIAQTCLPGLSKMSCASTEGRAAQGRGRRDY